MMNKFFVFLLFLSVSHLLLANPVEPKSADKLLDKTPSELKADAIQATISISASATSICAGGNVNFTSTVTSPGTSPTYAWKKNGGLVGTSSNYSSNTLANGDVITCEFTSSGSTVVSNSIMISVNMTVAPTVAISASNTVICTGTSVTFNSTLTNGGASPSYAWKKNGLVVAMTPTYTASNWANGDVIKLSVTSSAACAATTTSTSNSISLTVNGSTSISVTPAGPITFCTGNPTILYGTAGMSNYEWKMGNTTVQTGTSDYYVPTTSGIYKVIGTNANGCSATSSNVSIVVNSLPVANAGPDLTVCVGSSIQIGAAPVVSYIYTWSPSTYLSNINASNPVATPVNLGPTTYIVTTTNTTTACNNVDTVVVTAIPLPSVTLSTTGPASFCVNNPTTLIATSGLNNYEWKRNGATAQTGTINTFTPSASGSFTVTGSDGNGCSATSSPINIVINPLPSANAGVDKTVCIAATTTLGGLSTSGIAYSWSPSTYLSNPTVSNPTCTPVNLSPMTYTLTTVNTTTGCSNQDVVVVSVLPAPNAPSLSSTVAAVCQGSSILITPTSTGAASLNWYRNGISLYNKPITTTVNVTAPTLSADIYSIKAKGVNGCLSAFSNNVSAWVKPAAVPTITSVPAAVGSVITVCVPGGTSGSATLTANSTTASPSYSWKMSGAYIAGANTNTHTQTVTTTSNNKMLSVEATYPNGCVKTSASRKVSLVTAGCTPRFGDSKDNADATISSTLAIKLYPNPVNNVLNIELSSVEANDAKILLINTLGQVVLEKNISLNSGETNTMLDMSSLAKGIYTVYFQSNGVQHVEKIVKE